MIQHQSQYLFEANNHISGEKTPIINPHIKNKLINLNNKHNKNLNIIKK